MADAQKSKSIPDFEIASFKDRLLAYLIDWLVIIGSNLLIWPIMLTHLNPLQPEKNTDFLPYVIFLLTVLFYNLLFEISIKGQTPGKKSRHIKVLKRDRSPANFGNYLRRWVLHPTGILTMGYILGIALLIPESEAFVAASLGMAIFLTLLKIGKGRRLGDWLSRTVVIKSEQEISEALLEAKADDKPKAPASLIANIAQVSQNARSIYLLFVGLLAYCALTVAGTSDRRLILNEPARLPVINLDVSLDGFFILAPILCIFMFVYFQLYLHKLKRLFDDLVQRHPKMTQGHPEIVKGLPKMANGHPQMSQRQSFANCQLLSL